MDKIFHTCKYCGAPGVDYAEAQDGVVRCVYCGNVNDVPRKQPPTEVVLALNNADNELYNCRFEEARDSYSKVIAMSPDEPQAYFGRALAKFRVKYLKDERYSTENEAKYQPICYGVTEKLFSKDPDYLKALALATDKQQDIYKSQAQEIDTIVSNFQALKAKGVDYDAFICCKVTDDATGQKTRDSNYAHDLYNYLTKKGFKPFYSERDVKDNFTGSDYEAVILYALYTSESMLIVCSDENYLDTPWVKNEYSRFLAMTANGYKQQGSLTFVYDRAPIEKLPNGKKIQGIDRNAVGADDRIVKFVRQFQPQSQRATKFCAHCGNECRGSAKMCDECGSREFVSTHDEFVKAQALAQARKEQQEREEQLKKQQAEREEQLRREQQARDEELAALRRQLEEERNRKTQDAAVAAQQAKEEAERKAKEESERKAREEAARKAREEAERKAKELARADAEAEKYFEFERNYDGWSYSVSGCSRDLTEVTIPSQYKGLSVTEIGVRAFCGCSNLTSVTIPSSVISIGESAFDNCVNLQTLTFERDSQLQSIESYAFRDCHCLTSITIPRSVTRMGEGVFDDCYSLIIYCEAAEKPNGWDSKWDDFHSYPVVWNCLHNDVANDGYVYIIVDNFRYGLKNNEATVALYNYSGAITIPSRVVYKGKQYPVTSIGGAAFCDCSSLTSVTIPSGVRYIGDCAFYRCSGLTSIIIPDGVTSVGWSAFSDCTGLTSITIPSSVTSIGSSAFYRCSSLTSIIIPSSVTSVDRSAFFGCRYLVIYCEAAKEPYGWTFGWNQSSGPVVWNCLHNDVADDGYIYTIVNNFRYGLKDNEATVARYNYFGTITIPSQVEYKGKQYPVTTINAFTFSGLHSLTSITIPSSVTSIGEKAFSGCTNLIIYCEAVKKPDGWNNGWNNDRCPVVWNCLHNDVAANGYVYIIVDNFRYGLKDNKATVAGYNYSGTITIPSRVVYKGKQYPVTSIGEAAFCYCSSLTSITIPSSVTGIGPGACYGCRSLTSITIPSSVKELRYKSFYGCSKLTEVTMPKKLAGFMGSKLKDIFGDRYKQIKFTYTK